MNSLDGHTSYIHGMEHIPTTPLPARTRLFGAVLRVLASEPSGGPQMVALRARRARLIDSPPGRLVVGTDAAGVAVADRHIDNGIRLRIHTPAGTGPRPIVVNYHGGGWCLGSPEQSRWIAGRVAAQVGAIVVSPTYRLAPEHPYPAAVDDAWAALQWVRSNAAELGGDPDRIAVMGDSAGGNLAAVASLHARDAGGPALRAQVLVYPAVEMYERWPSEAAHAHAPLLTSKQMRTFGRLYLGDGYGTEDWQASPIRAASHASLPPALILTAGHDPLRDHGFRYADALRTAGVATEHHHYPDTIHGFAALPGVAPAAHTAARDVVEFLRRAL
ncbi:alpha/beta hydrolase [Rhodococcus zopfii]|uniref:alpha/beta hydrolase n=1 Tax=Rhodococcus zopfii TaxID=43772 RepID=UPI000AEC0CA9|nr:alpha/beta hydrolase [Rhodococcus zopfii]